MSALRTPDKSPMRRRRAVMLFSAIALTPYIALDLTLPAGRQLAIVGISWIAALLGCALLQRDGRPRLAAGGVLAAGVICVAGTVGKVVLTGGIVSPFFGLLFALAPSVALIVPEAPGAALATCLLSVGAGVALRSAEGRGMADVLYWAALASGAMAVSLYAARVARRTAARELALERERRSALESLAEAELKRLQLERLAEAGRLAAAVSHDMNSPLAAVRSSVSCLLTDLDAPAEERAEVLRDVAGAVERILGIVGTLRDVAQRAQGTAQPVPELLALTPPPGRTGGGRP